MRGTITKAKSPRQDTGTKKKITTAMQRRKHSHPSLLGRRSHCSRLVLFPILVVMFCFLQCPSVQGAPLDNDDESSTPQSISTWAKQQRRRQHQQHTSMDTFLAVATTTTTDESPTITTAARHPYDSLRHRQTKMTSKNHHHHKHSKITYLADKQKGAKTKSSAKKAKHLKGKKSRQGQNNNVRGFSGPPGLRGMAIHQKRLKKVVVPYILGAGLVAFVI